MKDDKTEIKKIVLTVGGKEITLTIDEAKKLKEILGELFGKDVIRETIIQDRPVWRWDYYRPYYSYGTSAGPMSHGLTDDLNKIVAECKQNALYCAIS